MGPRLNPSAIEYSPIGPSDWRFDFGMELGEIAPSGTGLSVYDHSEVGAPKGITVRLPVDPDAGGPFRLSLLWALDGAVDHDWTAHNDFKRMANNMCDRLYHEAATNADGSGDFVCE
jgi:hypothetical protein